MSKFHFPTKLGIKRFRVPRGLKEVWLPSFTITLLRTSYLPAHMACFQVPLNMNKLDMKDYLWNCYNVPVLSVRSYIQQQKVRAGKASDILFRANHWRRPKSTKRMIVELGEGEKGGPFAWPEPIENLEPWDKDTFDELGKEQKEQEEISKRPWEKRQLKDADLLAKQAQELLSGNKKWQPMKPIYSRGNSAST